MADEAAVLREIESRHKRWFMYFKFWKHLFWTCGVLCVTSSTLAAAEKVSGNAAPYFAVLSSVCIAVIGFSGPQRRAQSYVTAWRALGSALMRYKAGACDLLAVLEALDAGEKAIADGDAVAALPTSSSSP
jgi:hypothetical protein